MVRQMPSRLSVLIPCKNERNNLGPCIASARAAADEILVADSGSTDGTLELAHELADRVIQRDYVHSGDFKNWAIPQAKFPWVLILDADERLTPELSQEIRDVLQSGTTRHAFWLRRRNVFCGHTINHGDWSGDRVIRLLRRDRCRYRCHTDHAEIDVAGQRVGSLSGRLIHYTAWDLKAYLTKMTRYAEQQAELWQGQGKQPQVIHIVLNAPLRFLRGYIWRGGFLDGRVGFLIAALTAYYSFLKQLFFWQRVCGLKRRDVEPDQAAERPREVSPMMDSSESIGSFEAA